MLPMAAKLLNRAQREIVRGMVIRGADGDAVRKTITDMVRFDGWDYNMNVEFCGWLALNNYPQTEQHLERYINDPW